MAGEMIYTERRAERRRRRIPRTRNTIQTLMTCCLVSDVANSMSHLSSFRRQSTSAIDEEGRWHSRQEMKVGRSRCGNE